MQAICPPETSVEFQQTTPCYIPEDNIVYNHRCENLEFYNIYVTGTLLSPFDEPIITDIQMFYQGLGLIVNL